MILRPGAAEEPRCDAEERLHILAGPLRKDQICDSMGSSEVVALNGNTDREIDAVRHRGFQFGESALAVRLPFS